MLFPAISYVESLLPQPGRFPYYVVVPRYVRTSAGIRALHVLCHWLNKTGQSAFLMIYPDWNGLRVNPEIITPVLDEAIVEHHFALGLTPIVIYPEVLAGNPFAGPVRVRWIGNNPGLLGGMDKFDKDEICFAYSEHLAKGVNCPENILNVPVIDTNIFRPDPSVPRSGTCFYAAKYQEVHGGKVFGLPPGSFEITRDRPDQLSPREIADLFRRSERLYCFEDSAIANEAAFCGCPVVLMKNEFFKWPLAIDEVGWDGYAWGNEPAEIERAQRTVHKAYENYMRNIPKFFSQLHYFILTTQNRAKVTPYTRPVSLPGATGDTNVRLNVLRKRLGEALLDIASLKCGFNRSETLWIPELSRSGAASPAGFISGWSSPEPFCVWSTGPRSTLSVLPPVKAKLLEFFVRGFSSSASHLRDYHIYWDGEYLTSLQLAHEQAGCVSIPVIEPGKPMIITFEHPEIGSPAQLWDAPNDARQLGIMLVKVCATFSKSGETAPSAGPNAVAAVLDHAEPEASAAKYRLTQPPHTPLSARNCHVQFKDGALIVEAFSDDPQIIFVLDDVLSLKEQDVFLWGACECEKDDNLQVFLPMADGAFSEAYSVRTDLKSGTNAFSLSLPMINCLGVLRLDPLNYAGKIKFTQLELLVCPGSTRGSAIVEAATPRDLPPQLDRFDRHRLINGIERPLTLNCKLSFQDDRLCVEAAENPQIIFVLDDPVISLSGVYLSGSCFCEKAQVLKVFLPEPDSGEYMDDFSASADLAPGLNQFSLLLPPADVVSVLRIVPMEQSGYLEFKDLELLFAKED